MALNLNDSLTWTQSVLNTPAGPIYYWVIADWESYFEQFTPEGNLTRILIAVDWNERYPFRWYALGYAEKETSVGGGSTYLVRHTPLRCPYQDNQFLTDLKKFKIHVGTDSNGKPVFADPDPYENYWPRLQNTTGMPPRIVYDATFTTPNYDIIDQDTFLNAGWKETRRYVQRSEGMNARERKVPDCGFEIDDATTPPTVIPQVGFVPFLDWEFELTWMKVPVDLVPVSAIKACALRINQSVFDYVAKDPAGVYLTGPTYGRYAAGDVLFKGLSRKTTPYRGPNGEWLKDLPYLFGYQPADGTGNGMLKIPLGRSSNWVKIRESGSAADPKYMYTYCDMDALFKPEI